MRKLKKLISLLGRTRFVMLIVLIALNGVLAAAWQKIYLPKHQALTQQKSTVDSTRNRLQQEIVALPERFDILKKNDDRYIQLEESGLFQVQDRIEARARMESIRTRAGLRGIDYAISPQENVFIRDDHVLEGVLVRSNIEVDVKGLTDFEMRDFITRMNKDFSGLVVTKTVKLSLGRKLDEDSLRELGSKTPIDFVKGKVSFAWYSILPKPVDPNAAQNQAFGEPGQ